MPFEISFDNFDSWPQSRVIPDATPFNDGVMTAAQAARLAGLTPGGSGYATIEDEGMPVAQQTTLNFIGSAVTVADDPGNSRTNVTISAAASGYTTIGNGGVALPQQHTLNFDGTVLVATNNAGASRSDVVLANTAVAPGAYGDGTHVGSFTVDAQGRLTAAASVAITFPPVTTTLQQAYNNGVAGQQLVTLSAANLGVTLDIDGHLTSADRAFAVKDSTFNDPAGGSQMNYFAVVPSTAPFTGGGGILGFFDLGVRQTLAFWGGDATTCCDVMLAINKALANNLPAGNFAFRAQDAQAGQPTHSAGSILLVAGRGGGGIGGVNGSIIMGAPDNENNLTVPYFILNGNTAANGGAGWKVDPADTASVYQFDTDNDIRLFGNPLMRVGYLNGTRPRLDIFANQTKAGVFIGSSDGAQNGPLWVRTDTNFSEKWSGITLDNSTVGGHVVTWYTGNFASVGGLNGQTLFRDQTAGKYFLTVYPSGNLQIGDNLNTLVDPGFAVSTLDFYSPRYQGKVTTANISGATAITTSTTNGETFVLTGTSNVTSLSLLGGVAGQQVTLIFIQDAAGTTTWPSTITNVKLDHGSFTKTVTASAADVLQLRCIGSNVWYQVAPTSTNAS